MKRFNSEDEGAPETGADDALAGQQEEEAPDLPVEVAGPESPVEENVSPLEAEEVDEDAAESARLAAAAAANLEFLGEVDDDKVEARAAEEVG